MFELPSKDQCCSAARTDPRHVGIQDAVLQNGDRSSKRILLPRGSAQSRFAPPAYYYIASESGLTPSWVIDELSGHRRFHPHSGAMGWRDSP
jgi:hypothetical protein